MAEKLIKRGRIWYFRFTDHDGRRVMQKGCSDRRETEYMAEKARTDAAHFRTGFAGRKDIAYRDHEASASSNLNLRVAKSIVFSEPP